MLDGYLRTGGRDPRPALLGEANYERENNVPGSPPTTNETLRRQALWALTSGSPGTFFGSADWKFPPGWEGRLDTPAVRQLQAIRDLFAARSWWSLVPDEGADLVVAGRGAEMTHDDRNVSVVGNDYATVARARGPVLGGGLRTDRTHAHARPRWDRGTADGHVGGSRGRGQATGGGRGRPVGPGVDPGGELRRGTRLAAPRDRSGRCRDPTAGRRRSDCRNVTDEDAEPALGPYDEPGRNQCAWATVEAA